MKKRGTTTLTAEEDRAFNDAFNDAVIDGKTDLQADKYAAKVAEKRFPRLKKFAHFR